MALETYAAVRKFVFLEGNSRREAARLFGLSRDTVAKMCLYSAPPSTASWPLMWGRLTGTAVRSTRLLPRSRFCSSAPLCGAPEGAAFVARLNGPGPPAPTRPQSRGPQNRGIAGVAPIDSTTAQTTPAVESCCPGRASGAWSGTVSQIVAA